MPYLGIWDATNTHRSFNPSLGQSFGCFTAIVPRSSKAKSNPSSDPLQLGGASRLFLIGCGTTASPQPQKGLFSWKYRYPMLTTSPRESWDWLAGKKGSFLLWVYKFLGPADPGNLQMFTISEWCLKWFLSDLVLMFQIGVCDFWVILREFEWFLSDFVWLVYLAIRY